MQLFDLNGLEKRSLIEPTLIQTSLGAADCSLRWSLPDGSFQELLGQPDVMFKSAPRQPDARIYFWKTEQVSAGLSIRAVTPVHTSVESKYLVEWRAVIEQPNLRLSGRVGFKNADHSFSWYEQDSTTVNDSDIWTNQDFIKDDSPTASVVAIAATVGLKDFAITDRWGVYGACVEHPQAKYSNASFVIASGINVRCAFTEPPEFFGVLHLDESQIVDFADEVNPNGWRI